MTLKTPMTCDQWDGILRDICEGRARPLEETNKWRALRGIPPLEVAPAQAATPVRPVPSWGLGTEIKNALTAIGVTEERVTSWLGAPCGCGERVMKLDRLTQWAVSKLPSLESLKSIIG